MFPYDTLQDVVHQAIRVDKKNMRNGKSRVSQHPSTSSSWQRPHQPYNSQTEGAPLRQPSASTASSPAVRNQDKRPVVSARASSTPSPAKSFTHSSSIQCHKCKGRGHISSECPSRRTMIINARGEWESESDTENGNHEVEDGHEWEVEGNILSHEKLEGEALVVCRSLNAQVVEEEKGQRHNLFHTRRLVNSKLCRVIVDRQLQQYCKYGDGRKITIATKSHPHPYRMQWLNDCGSIKACSSVRIPFSVGAYVDEVECDVVPMHDCHLLLGRPWLHDRDVQISGRANRLCFIHGREKYTWLSMTPEEIYLDDLKRKGRERVIIHKE